MRSPIRIPIVGKTDANGNLTLPIKSQLAHHCSLNLAAKGTGTPTWEVDLDGSPELFGSGSKVVLGPMYTYPGQVISLVISAGQPNDQITGTLSGVQADTAEELQLAPGAPQVAGFTIGIVSGEFQVTDLKVTGLTGAANASRYVGATLGGAPTSGSFLQGDYVVDETNGILWICVTGGTPGTWRPSGPATLAPVTPSGVTSVSMALPSGFTNAHFEGQVRSDVVANNTDVYIQFNGDTASSYVFQQLYGNANVATSQQQAASTTQPVIARVAGANALANIGSTFKVDITNYSGGTFIKEAFGFSQSWETAAAAGEFIIYRSARWNAVTVLTSVLFGLVAGNYVAGSRISGYVE